MTVAKTSNGNYVPIEILKKESKDGYNIRKGYDASKAIDRTNHEIAAGRYIIWQLENQNLVGP